MIGFGDVITTKCSHCGHVLKHILGSTLEAYIKPDGSQSSWEPYFHVNSRCDCTDSDKILINVGAY